tara:strand:+ start:837 stop:1925 length:1089 start_codon:yes stop_codon:yes gene_type:complete
MTIKSSGSSLAFSEIEAEFGQNGLRSLGRYRANSIHFTNKTAGDLGRITSPEGYLPLDNGVPKEGEIAFSDFYSKKLNIVVDCHSGSTESRKNAKTDKWNNNAVMVVGGYRNKKEGGSKIIIHINKTFQSSAGNPSTACALRTGTWNSTSTVQVDIGGEGRCYGAGGKGGDGADGRTDFGPVTGSVGDGQNGTSALGVEHNGAVVNMRSGSQLIAGYGGGGGGQGGRQVDSGADRTSCGGGGGGGAGQPPGPAGEGGQRLSGGGDEVASASDGGAGSTTSGGGGGAGGNNFNETIGATGGVGGDSEQSAGAGGSVYNGKNTYGGNGAAGSSGAAVRRTSGISITVNTNGQTVNGSTTATGVT